MFPECWRHMVSGFGQPGMHRDMELWDVPTSTMSPKVTVLAGHHYCAGIKEHEDSEALLCCPCSSPPSSVNPTFEAPEHPKNGTGSRAAPGTGRLVLACDCPEHPQL